MFFHVNASLYMQNGRVDPLMLKAGNSLETSHRLLEDALKQIFQHPIKLAEDVTANMKVNVLTTNQVMRGVAYPIECTGNVEVCDVFIDVDMQFTVYGFDAGVSIVTYVNYILDRLVTGLQMKKHKMYIKKSSKNFVKALVALCETNKLLRGIYNTGSVHEHVKNFVKFFRESLKNHSLDLDLLVHWGNMCCDLLQPFKSFVMLEESNYLVFAISEELKPPTDLSKAVHMVVNKNTKKLANAEETEQCLKRLQLAMSLAK